MICGCGAPAAQPTQTAATFDAPGGTDTDATESGNAPDDEDSSDEDSSAGPWGGTSDTSAGPSGSTSGDTDSGDDADEPDVIPIEGFGAGTRGGWQPGSTTYHVTSLADAGPGTLREAVQTDDAPRVVVFDVDGEIPLSSAIALPSNITIDGRGHDVTLLGKGLILPGSDEVIVTNLAIVSVGPDTEDGIMIGNPAGASEHVVIDHVRFEQFDDGGNADNVDEAISVIFGSRNITVAWCAFLRWEKVILIGNGDAPASVDETLRVTFHHNWAHNTGRRHPKARFGLFDFYNNYLDDWRMYNWQYISDKRSYGAEVTDHARLLFENNIVRRDDHGYDLLSEADQVTLCDGNGAYIDQRNTWVTPNSSAGLEFGVDCPDIFPPIERPYDVTLDNPDEALRTRLESQTGNVL
jgi:pectate lyase